MHRLLDAWAKADPQDLGYMIEWYGERSEWPTDLVVQRLDCTVVHVACLALGRARRAETDRTWAWSEAKDKEMRAQPPLRQDDYADAPKSLY